MRGLHWLAVTLVTVACGSDGTEQAPDFETRTVGLHAFESCDGLLEYLHAEAAAELERFGEVAPPVAVDAAGRGAVGEPQAGGEGNGDTYSRTNVQEAGVDEPDIVKTDGLFIYLVRGQTLLIYDAADLTLMSETPLAGYDARLLLDGDDLVVLAQRWNAPLEDFPDADAERLNRVTKTVVSLFDVSDRAGPTLVRRMYVEGYLQAARLVGRTVRAAVYHDAAGVIAWDVDASGGGGQSEPGQPPRTGGTVDPEPTPDVGAPDEAGQEKHDEEAALEAWQAAIDETTIEDWLPRVYTVAGDTRSATSAARCERFHRPGERAGTGVAVLFGVDLDAPETRLDDPAVVTGPGVVYASAASFYLTTSNHHAWPVRGGDVAVGVGGEPVAGETGGGATTGGTDTVESPLEVADDDRIATQLHRLDIAEGSAGATYRASGRVFGIPLNQFSLGEHADHLRVATTEQRWGDAGDESENHVFVLAEVDVADAEAGRSLEVVGEVTGLAPGERIYAVRFIGDRGFVVTFKQVDPLFTLDLSDPADPRLMGELKVPGFSTYLHPFGDDHLMGIGQSATEEGRVTGLQLSLFDVSDLAAPALAHSELLGEGWSEALYDHHAFTFWEPTSTLMVPTNAWDGEAPRMGLDVYRVNLEDGFVADGHVSHADLVEGWRPHVRRSLVIGDAVFSVSDVGMKVNGMDDLMERARCVFPEGQDPDQPPGRDGPGDREGPEEREGSDDQGDG